MRRRFGAGWYSRAIGPRTTSGTSPAPDGDRPLLGPQGENPLVALAAQAAQRAGAGLGLRHQKDDEPRLREPPRLRLGRGGIEDPVEVEPAASGQKPRLVARQGERPRERVRGRVGEVEHDQARSLGGPPRAALPPGR